MGYTKLFSDIIHSTIWGQSNDTKVLWITMLAMKDRWHIVNSSAPGLSRAAGVSMECTLKGLELLSNPDPFSRTPDFEGRRIKACPGGWIILNGEHYRNKMSIDERREYNRIKQAEYRNRNKDKDVKSCVQLSTECTHTEVRNKRSKEIKEKNKKEKKEKPQSKELNPQDFIDYALINFPEISSATIRQFTEHRHRLGKQLTYRALKQNLNMALKLSKKQGCIIKDPDEIIQYVIKKNWIGVQERYFIKKQKLATGSNFIQGLHDEIKN